MHRALIIAGSSCLLLCLSFLFVDNASAQQEQLAAETDLNKFSGVGTRVFYQLVRGERPPSGEEDEKHIRLASEYIVYAVTIKTLQQQPGVLHKRREESGSGITAFRPLIIQDIMHSNNVNKNKEFRKLFTKELINRFERVFELDFNGNRVALVNAGLLLPIFAELQDDEIANFLAGLIEKKENPDVVKLFAFRGLQVHFGHKPMRIDPFAENEVRKQYAKQINPVIDYILTPPAKLKEMSEAEKEAYRYIRCEAIKAVAKTQTPWIPDLPALGKTKPEKVFAPMAYALLRVLATDDQGLSPTPSLAEKLEAVKGLCSMDATRSLVLKEKPHYNPDLAVKLVGQTLIEFATEYGRDLIVFQDKASKLPPEMHWKATAEELRAALKQFSGNVPAASQKNVNQIINQANPIFNRIRNYGAVEETSGLQSVVNSIPAPNPEVYRGFEYKVNVP